MTTMQTQAHRGTYNPTSTKVRGVKGFVIGLVALAAAATGIGFAVSGADDAPATVIAPVGNVDTNAEQRAALERIEERIFGGGATQESEVVWSQPGKPAIR